MAITVHTFALGINPHPGTGDLVPTYGFTVVKDGDIAGNETLHDGAALDIFDVGNVGVSIAKEQYGEAGETAVFVYGEVETAMQRNRQIAEHRRLAA
jgi:hypothetical protein